VGLLLIGGLGVGLADGCRPARAPARPPNVLVVVTDTARADAFSYEAGGPTPGAKQLASDGVRYRQARSTSAWTLPAHASLFTGLYPSNHDAHHENLLLDNERLTLAELLQPTHDTAAFCENPHISPSAGFDQGFDLFVETWRSTPPMTITRSWEEFLAARTGEAAGERPFFLFVNILDPHLPYRPPPAFARATLPAGTSDEQRHRATMVAMPQAVGHMAGTAPLDDEALATLRGLYAAEVSYADTRIGGLLDLLRETGELDRTLVVWTSDHGENIGDHGLMDHQFCLY